MTIREIIQKVIGGEITCRGGRSAAQELIKSLTESERKISELDSKVLAAPKESQNLSAMKEELYGVESENIKYRKSVDELTRINEKLLDFAVEALRSLGEFRSSISIPSNILNEYEIDGRKVVAAYLHMPKVGNIGNEVKDLIERRYVDLIAAKN